MLDRSGLPLITKGSNHALAGALLSQGLYDPRFVRYLRKTLGKNDVYVDVGANIGLFCLEAAKHLGPQGRIIAFEPNSECRALLRKNVEMRIEVGLATCGFDVRGEAVASASTTVDLVIPEDHDGRSSVKADDAWYSTQVCRVERVSTTTLDEALADVRYVKLLKIDVEGAELDVLRGAQATISERRIALLDMEYIPSLAGNDARSIERLIEQWVAGGALVGTLTRLGSFQAMSQAHFRRGLPSAAHLIVDFRHEVQGPSRRVLN